VETKLDMVVEMFVYNDVGIDFIACLYAYIYDMKTQILSACCIHSGRQLGLLFLGDD